jgi:hypothetical protein
MVSLAEPGHHLLAESEERSTQQAHRECKQKGGSVDVLQPKERAHKSHQKQQRRAKSAGKCQQYCAAQKSDAPPQVRKIGPELSPSGIPVGDVIQGADTVDDTCQLSLQDRDEQRSQPPVAY